MYDVDEKTPRPRWACLYASTTLLIGLLGLVESAVPDGAARRLLELVVTAMIFGAMALWVRLNRLALWRANERRLPARAHADLARFRDPGLRDSASMKNGDRAVTAVGRRSLRER
jgi:hypothetical protein